MFKFQLLFALAFAVIMAATDPTAAQSGFEQSDGETREFDDVSPMPGLTYDTEEFVDEDGQVFVSVNMLPYEYRCWMKRVSLDNQCATTATRKSWFNERCEKCRCRPRNYVTCCTAVQKPIDYPSGCIPLLNKTKCKVVLRSKHNITSPCRRNFMPSLFRRLHPNRTHSRKIARESSRRQ